MKANRRQAAGGLLVLLCTSPWFIRRRLRARFRIAHSMLALVLLVSISWHVLSQPDDTPKICALICGALWGMTTLYRLLKAFCYVSGAEVRDAREHRGVTRVRVSCKRMMNISPGSYFYVIFPGILFGYNIMNNRPLMVVWRDPRPASTEPADLTFLLSHHGHRLRPPSLVRGQKLLLDGPYGHDLGLQHYETVILASKGIGIAGVLASALHLLERQKHDAAMKRQASKTSKPYLFRDATRKVDILWSLEHESQEEWVASELRSLQELDAANVGHHLN